MPRKLLTISLAEYAWDVLAEAESPSGGYGQSTSSKGFSCCQNWNKSNERKCTFTLTRMCTKLYFRDKGFCTYCINCIFLIFLLKGLLNQQFAPLKRAGGIQLSLILSIVCFSLLFVSLLKNTLFFNVTSCKVYLFAIIVLSLKRSTEMSTESH